MKLVAQSDDSDSLCESGAAGATLIRRPTQNIIVPWALTLHNHPNPATWLLTFCHSTRHRRWSLHDVAENGRQTKLSGSTGRWSRTKGLVEGETNRLVDWPTRSTLVYWSKYWPHLIHLISFFPCVPADRRTGSAPTEAEAPSSTPVLSKVPMAPCATAES